MKKYFWPKLTMKPVAASMPEKSRKKWVLKPVSGGRDPESVSEIEFFPKPWRRIGVARHAMPGARIVTEDAGR
jgi:hypothetical protein